MLCITDFVWHREQTTPRYSILCGIIKLFKPLKSSSYYPIWILFISTTHSESFFCKHVEKTVIFFLIYLHVQLLALRFWCLKMVWEISVHYCLNLYICLSPSCLVHHYAAILYCRSHYFLPNYSCIVSVYKQASCFPPQAKSCMQPVRWMN